MIAVKSLCFATVVFGVLSLEKNKPDPEVICRLPIYGGPCYDLLIKWAYVPEKQKCVPFGFGGCKSNGNNFNSKEECGSFCNGTDIKPAVGKDPEVICRLPIYGGPCNDRLIKWAYLAEKRKCVSFDFGGCKSNGNNFNSKQECGLHCNGI